MDKPARRSNRKPLQLGIAPEVTDQNKSLEVGLKNSSLIIDDRKLISDLRQWLAQEFEFEDFEELEQEMSQLSRAFRVAWLETVTRDEYLRGSFTEFLKRLGTPSTYDAAISELLKALEIFLQEPHYHDPILRKLQAILTVELVQNYATKGRGLICDFARNYLPTHIHLMEIMDQKLNRQIGGEVAEFDISSERNWNHLLGKLASHFQTSLSHFDSKSLAGILGLIDALNMENAEPANAFDETCDALTGNSQKMFKFLYKQKYKTPYQSLKDSVWKKEVQDPSISRAIDRLAKSLNEMETQYFSVVNESSNCLVKVEAIYQQPSNLKRNTADK